ncbi:MAG: hypothetical protein M3Y50_15360 [Acidobacteriota bacterium]|nr:hypothetical protein [Acidobacteriota bacterium]
MNINMVYIALAIVFALVLTYMFVYNTRLRTRQRTMSLKGREPVSKEEGIAIATQEKERNGKTGSF